MKNDYVDEFLTKEFYKSSDFALVTTISLYFPIVSVDKTDPKRVLFTFEQSKKLGKLLDLYWQGKVMIEPQQFFSQLKNIKTRIYSNK